LVYIKKSKAHAIRRAAFVSVCMLCTVTASYSAYNLYNGRLSKKALDSLNGSAGITQSRYMPVVRAKFNMRQGELLDSGKAELIEVPDDLIPSGAITSLSKLNNMRLRREIAEKEFLNNIDLMPESAVYEEGDRLIEHNFAEGAVPAAVAEGSIIDIKLFMKGGEDSIVVSKAAVISRNSNLLSFYMNETEQEYIKEAASEGMLFAVKYVDNLQEASEVTYAPSYDKERK